MKNIWTCYRNIKLENEDKPRVKGKIATGGAVKYPQLRRMLKERKIQECQNIIQQRQWMEQRKEENIER
jgi:hypothetical protein